MPVAEQVELAVSVRWRGGRLARLDAPGKESLELEWPSGLHEEPTGDWSPEELLVAAVATSYAETLACVAEELRAPLIDASIGATGRLGGDDGRPGLVAIAVEARLETIAGEAYAVASAAGVAEERCPIVRTLDVPVRVSVEVTAVAPAM